MYVHYHVHPDMEDTPVPAAEVLIDLKGMTILSQVHVRSFIYDHLLIEHFCPIPALLFYVHVYVYGATLFDPLCLAEHLIEVV